MARASFAFALGVAAAAAASAFGCASAPPSADPDNNSGVIWPTDTIADKAGEKYFQPVAEMLVRRCGTLDCHGQIGRNLRIYGKEGIRLDPNGTLSLVSGNQKTTAAEVLADYRSLVGLEPEVVVQLWGQAPDSIDPTQWVVIRKARGLEHHTGGSPTLDNNGKPDHADACLTNWLAAKDPTKDCQAALTEMCPTGTKANPALGSCDVVAK